MKNILNMKWNLRLHFPPSYLKWTDKHFQSRQCFAFRPFWFFWKITCFELNCQVKVFFSYQLCFAWFQLWRIVLPEFSFFSFSGSYLDFTVDKICLGVNALMYYLKKNNKLLFILTSIPFNWLYCYIVRIAQVGTQRSISK